MKERRKKINHGILILITNSERLPVKRIAQRTYFIVHRTYSSRGARLVWVLGRLLVYTMFTSNFSVASSSASCTPSKNTSYREHRPPFLTFGCSRYDPFCEWLIKNREGSFCGTLPQCQIAGSHNLTNLIHHSAPMCVCGVRARLYCSSGPQSAFHFHFQRIHFKRNVERSVIKKNTKCKRNGQA